MVNGEWFQVNGGVVMMAKTVRDLDVYQLSFKAQQRIFEITKRFPSEEKFSLTDQIRRSSRSVGANMSEAWAKRRYEAHFTSKLTDADGEAEETVHWLNSSEACGYIDQETCTELTAGYSQISAMIHKMINTAESWCRPFAKH